MLNNQSHNQDIQKILANLPRPNVPPMLENRILNSLHTHQQKSSIWEKWRQKAVLLNYTIAFIAIILWTYQLTSNKTNTLLSTLIKNPSALPSLGTDLFFVLLETIPLEGLVVILASLSVVSLLKSIRFKSSLPTHHYA
jgi:hypothetical protein